MAEPIRWCTRRTLTVAHKSMCNVWNSGNAKQSAASVTAVAKCVRVRIRVRVECQRRACNCNCCKCGCRWNACLCGAAGGGQMAAGNVAAVSVENRDIHLAPTVALPPSQRHGCLFMCIDISMHVYLYRICLLVCLSAVLTASWSSIHTSHERARFFFFCIYVLPSLPATRSPKRGKMLLCWVPPWDYLITADFGSFIFISLRNGYSFLSFHHKLIWFSLKYDRRPTLQFARPSSSVINVNDIEISSRANVHVFKYSVGFWNFAELQWCIF